MYYKVDIHVNSSFLILSGKMHFGDAVMNLPPTSPYSNRDRGREEEEEATVRLI